MSFSRDWWVSTLPLMVQGHGGYAQVRVQTYSGCDYLVRDVVKTHEGTVTLNVYLDSRGESPIIAHSSSAFDFDVAPVLDHICVTLDFNDISNVKVVPAMAMDVSRFH